MELTSDGSFARTNPSCALYLAASSVPSPLDASGLLQEWIDAGGADCRVGAGCTQGFPLGDVSSVCIWVVLCVGEDVIASAGADGRGVGLLDGDAKMIGHLEMGIRYQRVCGREALRVVVDRGMESNLGDRRATTWHGPTFLTEPTESQTTLIDLLMDSLFMKATPHLIPSHR